MTCDKCGKDRCVWTELCAIARKDTTRNCYSMFHPVTPDKSMICWECLGWEKLNVSCFHLSPSTYSINFSTSPESSLQYHVAKLLDICHHLSVFPNNSSYISRSISYAAIQHFLTKSALDIFVTPLFLVCRY